ncbi:uncharacterized protein LOC126893803 [Daktulosphaira vitifoliae]|uniref:uncharacterized protein LOC126893803 n=1 Tax=Daktulosphaira vitifoliae TaxID=58002 RepID=UPI0021A9BB26|nr:uncharacterized protein LOC126893803 [Daktulosphaira vitifoliae]XP_050520272.1 uncharacterized protein LOC126893803 [Daktulosphaira vitifoliae]
MEEFKVCENESTKVKLQGLDLILKSINCENYKSKFVEYGIDEYTMLYLTASDLRQLDVSECDIPVILSAISVLSKTSNYSKVKLSNEEISKLQSNICGQLGSIAIALNYIYDTLSSNPYEDKLIDDYLSTIDAATMLKPYLRKEEDSVKKTLKSVYKTRNGRKTFFITATTCTVILCVITFGYIKFVKREIPSINIWLKSSIYLPKLNQIKIWKF